ncbi:MAG: hypothetical protein V4691_01295 [Pseudomonadota bacterium]
MVDGIDLSKVKQNETRGKKDLIDTFSERLQVMEQIQQANGGGQIVKTEKGVNGAKFNSAKMKVSDFNREELLKNGIDYDQLVRIAAEDGDASTLSSRDLALWYGGVGIKNTESKGLSVSENASINVWQESGLNSFDLEKGTTRTKSELMDIMANDGILPKKYVKQSNIYVYDASIPLTETNMKLMSKYYGVDQSELTKAAKNPGDGTFSADKAMDYILKQRFGDKYDENKIEIAKVIPPAKVANGEYLTVEDFDSRGGPTRSKSAMIDITARAGALPRKLDDKKESIIYDSSAPVTEANIKAMAKLYRMDESELVKASKDGTKFSAEKAMNYILEQRLGKGYDPDKIPYEKVVGKKEEPVNVTEEREVTEERKPVKFRGSADLPQ